MKTVIFTPDAPKPIGPYSQAVLSNGTLYISGQIPINPQTGQLMKDDIKSQAKQVMENLKAILKEAGMDFNQVVKTSIFVSDINNFSQVNEVYGSYFSNEFPARETFEVCKLPLNADVEISMIAVK